MATLTQDRRKIFQLLAKIEEQRKEIEELREKVGNLEAQIKAAADCLPRIYELLD